MSCATGWCATSSAPTPRTRRAEMKLPTKDQVRYHGERWTWVLGLALLAYLTFPSGAGEAAPLVETGKFADRDLIAPYTFAVSKSDEELAREAEELAGTVKPIYEFQPRGLDSARVAVHTFFATADAAGDKGPQAIIQAARDQGVTLTLGEAAYLSKSGKRRNVEKALDELLERTLALGATGPGVLQVEQAQELIIRRRSGETSVPRDQGMSYALYRTRARTVHPDKGSSVGDAVYLKLAGHFFRPTLVPNAAETERRRGELGESVDPSQDIVRAGDRIVGAHEVVTSEAHEKLVALRNDLVRRGAATGRSLGGLLGALLRDGLVLSIYWVLMLVYRRGGRLGRGPGGPPRRRVRVRGP